MQDLAVCPERFTGMGLILQRLHFDSVDQKGGPISSRRSQGTQINIPKVRNSRHWAPYWGETKYSIQKGFGLRLRQLWQLHDRAFWVRLTNKGEGVSAVDKFSTWGSGGRDGLPQVSEGRLVWARSKDLFDSHRKLRPSQLELEKDRIPDKLSASRAVDQARRHNLYGHLHFQWTSEAKR